MASESGGLLLDFASDSEPGGGWRSHQQGTQEEALCRSSNLGLCLEAIYGKTGPGHYMPHNGAVYVQDVVLFRQQDGHRPDHYPFLQRAFWNGSADDFEILRRKVRGILAVATSNGHRHLVLGAWGCGAFGNDSEKLAIMFRSELQASSHAFDHVVFAIPKRRANWQAFQRAFADADVVQPSSEASEFTESAEWLVWEVLRLITPSLVAAALVKVREAFEASVEGKTEAGATPGAAEAGAGGLKGSTKIGVDGNIQIQGNLPSGKAKGTRGARGTRGATAGTIRSGEQKLGARGAGVAHHGSSAAAMPFCLGESRLGLDIGGCISQAVDTDNSGCGGR